MKFLKAANSYASEWNIHRTEGWYMEFGAMYHMTGDNFYKLEPWSISSS